MVLDVRKSAVESAGEGIDFARNILVVGTCHFLNPEEKARIETRVSEADFVCIEWDQIRDNDAKGRPFGINHYLHNAYFDPTRIEGDHLYANWGDIMQYDVLKDAVARSIRNNAVKNGGVARFESADGNEFLYIQELCREQGKDCYFVDRLESHTRYRVMIVARVVGIVESFAAEGRDRSQYMEAETLKIAQKRFAATGRQEQCALFVGSGHLKDFSDRKFRKDNPHEPKN